MNEASIANYITKTFPGVETSTDFGYTFFFHGADRKLPFATLISSDYEYDRISNLDRPGVFRLNIGVSRETFQSLFGAAKVEVGLFDFTALDVIMPHPEYANNISYLCFLPVKRRLRKYAHCLPKLMTLPFRGTDDGTKTNEAGSVHAATS